MDFEKMTYKEFKDFCNPRAADGRWGLSQAITCLNVVGTIEGNNRGFFKKRKKEEKWREMRGVVIDAFEGRS